MSNQRSEGWSRREFLTKETLAVLRDSSVLSLVRLLLPGESLPTRIDGTDWRFVKALKKELKG